VPALAAGDPVRCAANMRRSNGMLKAGNGCRADRVKCNQAAVRVPAGCGPAKLGVIMAVLP
jgi:hypothetical protein